MSSELLQQLAALPRHWSYVAVDGQKRPYMDGWQKNHITRASALSARHPLAASAVAWAWAAHDRRLGTQALA